VVVLDEVHERSVPSDVLMALLKEICAARPIDFKLIVMSATIDLPKFMAYFGSTSVVKVEGRTFPIQVYNTQEP
jgi:HrpA-like RNA helicase